ncbi:PD-(D/E)XK nuclease family protein [Leeuwenhoekiella sp. ZYFB001]|uniref:PD-(D/E)XK nuclease family protein n=1 Tax=Leeuwenhoekiella sp. ZYFB001 TaxID=2719912 RepID=UPI001432069A|nr:PD-(D/E)XK nuclease family protein [Leeuwenhoekiella sp. ZYFB001]
MNLTTLQEFLDTAEIPIIEPKPLTFLEIAKQPHYENVLSNIYAFFFDVAQEHGFQDLFIQSLLELIQESKLGKEKEALQSFSDFAIETEYNTDNGGRIDLLLHNEQQAIIIENKVYHFLANDLDDYWESIIKKGRQESEMIGIILSLDPIYNIECKKPETVLHYINILHQDLIQRILKNSGSYLLQASDKYAVYLKDLAQNIQNMSTPDMKPEELQFYKDNRDRLIQAKKFFERFEDYIKKQIEEAFSQLDRDKSFLVIKNNKGKNHLHIFSKRNPDLMFTIGFARLWDNESHSMNVIVELQKKALNNRSIYKEIAFTDKEYDCIANNFYKETNQNWCHFAKKNYTETEINFNYLSAFLIRRIEEDHLLSIFKKLDAFLTEYRSKPQPL